ncbi:MAG: hypothetical protein NT113_25090 [Hyphomicrobiales bacterium]|jgi:hypothetical protein|nr:hypothetical protein [Hyphomicrobiales bacterium]
MPIKFEWQFKYRDERFLNADTPPTAHHARNTSIHAGFCNFVDFGLPCRLGIA